MSANQSIITQLEILESSLTQQMSAISQMRKTLGLAELSLPETKTKTKKTKKTKTAAAEGSAKETREPTAWNTLVTTTVADMRQNGWQSWTDLSGKEWPASRAGNVKDKSGAERSTHVYDGGDHDGKEPNPSLGGMVRASYLKAQSDPVAAEKARKYHAKLAEKRSAAGSTGSGEKGEPEADAEAPKKAGRRKMTDKEKADAKLNREAKKAAEAAKPEPEEAEAEEAEAEAEAEEAEAEAEFEEPEAEAEAEAKPAPVAAPKPAPVAKPTEAKPAPATPKAKKMVISGAPVKAKKPVDLSFFAWEHKGQDYFTNDRGDVVSTEFEWVGRFDGTKIDASAPEPEDLGSARMRE